MHADITRPSERLNGPDRSTADALILNCDCSFPERLWALSRHLTGHRSFSATDKILLFVETFSTYFSKLFSVENSCITVTHTAIYRNRTQEKKRKEKQLWRSRSRKLPRKGSLVKLWRKSLPDQQPQGTQHTSNCKNTTNYTRQMRRIFVPPLAISKSIVLLGRPFIPSLGVSVWPWCQTRRLVYGRPHKVAVLPSQRTRWFD